jgi:hypothetical protein
VVAAAVAAVAMGAAVAGWVVSAEVTWEVSAEVGWQALAEIILAVESRVTTATEDVISFAAGITTTALVARITRHTTGLTPAPTDW